MIRLKKYLCLLGFLMVSHLVVGQDKLDSLSFTIQKEQTLLEFCLTAEETNTIRFYFVPDWIDKLRVFPDYSGLSLRDLLKKATENSEIDFYFLDNYAVVFIKDPSGSKVRDNFVENAKRNKIKVDQLDIGTDDGIVKEVQLQGVVQDTEHNSPLVGALVYVNGENIQTTTDATGRFQLKLLSGEYIIGFRYVNFEERIVRLNIFESGVVNMKMDELPTTLNEVIVSDKSITSSRVGESSIKMTDLTRAPTFLGEADIVKQLQTQPGVTSVSEASSGFNVRGGGVDQNLVLYDGVPVFNTSHAFGFFSSFNADAIKEASFQKGGISAEFGGRVSSVLKMVSKEGDYNRWRGEFGIGLVSSNLTIGGPIKRDTSSLLISFRTTYSDWILKLLQNSYNDIEKSSVFFYDASIKYAQKLKDGGKLTFSSYVSQDKFTLSTDTLNSWQNITLSMRYDNKIADDLFYSVGAYIGNYAFSVEKDQPSTAFNLKYNTFYPAIKFDFNLDKPRNKYAFGFHSTFYNFSPGELHPTTPESNSKTTVIPDENSFENALYFSDVFFLGEKLSIEAGIRLSLFTRIGPATVYLYEPDSPKEPYNIIDSVVYKSGQNIKTYFGPEPRLSFRYMINLNSSIKFGYNRIYQYIHLISNTASVTPVDIWQSSNTYFRPQIGDQVSLGYFRTSKSRKFDFQVEAFYKYIQNILDFKDGASLILNPQLETALLPGNGESYGLEVSVAKLTGRLTGGINYTYSRSLRQVNSPFENETINEGAYYPANYDQPHILNLNWSYKVARKIFFSGTFLYHTGRPISFPLAAYEINGAPVIDYSERNNYRIPNYHRLDLALVIEGNNRKNKRVESNWAISIYNVYGRRNPYSAFFENNVAGSVKPYQIALIGVPIPSISYGLKF